MRKNLNNPLTRKRYINYHIRSYMQLPGVFVIDGVQHAIHATGYWYNSRDPTIKFEHYYKSKEIKITLII